MCPFNYSVSLKKQKASRYCVCLAGRGSVQEMRGFFVVSKRHRLIFYILFIQMGKLCFVFFFSLFLLTTPLNIIIIQNNWSQNISVKVCLSYNLDPPRPSVRSMVPVQPQNNQFIFHCSASAFV